MEGEKFAQVKIEDLKKTYDEECDDVKRVLRRMYPDMFDQPKDIGDLGVEIGEDGDGYKVIRITHQGETIGFVADGEVRCYNHKEYTSEHREPGPIMSFRIIEKRRNQ